MPNRHAPHSHQSPPPKAWAKCHHCDKPIRLQHERPKHQCTELCHEYGAHHDYSHEPLKPVVRYFDDQLNEMCEECMYKEPHKRRRHVAQQIQEDA